jgi:recombination protein RecA
VIFINQIRDKIGVSWGSPETTTGGRALKFYSSVRLDIRRIGAIKDGTNVTGNRTRVKVVKNKVAAPFREAEFDIIYGRGIDNVSEIIDLATEKNVITKKASWCYYGKDQIGQGKEAVRQWLLNGKLDEIKNELHGKERP